MRDSIEAQLEQAGTLLREWRDEHNSSPAPIDLNAAYPQASPSRRTYLSLALAATTLIALVGVLAATLIRGDDQQLPVVTPGASVALVPSESWLEGRRLTGVYEDESFGSEQVLFVPEDDPGAVERRVAVSIDAHVAIGGPGEEVEGSGLTGIWGLQGRADDNLAVQVLSIPLDVRVEPFDSGYLTLVAGGEQDVDELLALAAQIDPELPLAGQTPAGWRPMDGAAVALVDAELRMYTIDAGDASLWSTQLSGAGPNAEWHLMAPGTGAAVAEIGGRSVHVDDFESRTIITWVESPGLVVQFAVIDHSATTQQRMAIIEELLEALDPVDQAGWRAFAERAEPDDADSDALEPPPPFSERPDALTVRLTDGRNFEIYRSGTGELCWRELVDEATPSCEEANADDPATGPLIAFDDEGSPLFVFGSLAQGATHVWIEAAPTPGSGRGYSAGFEMWASTDLAPGATLVVSHLGPDQLVVERQEIQVPR